MIVGAGLSQTAYRNLKKLPENIMLLDRNVKKSDPTFICDIEEIY